MRSLLISLFLLVGVHATADEQIVLGLSQDEVAINATFNGSELLLFGAVKRDAPAPEGDLDVIVTISGPSTPITVRRKERRFGIWVNTEGVNVDAAPSFYAVATSGPLDEIIKDIEDLRHAIAPQRAIRSVGARISGTEEFTDALIRIREKDLQYQVLEGAVEIADQSLFRTSVALPANLTEGDYRTRIYLLREGEIIDEYDTSIPVNKVGIERWLYDLAQDRAALYGIMSLAIAIAAGWMASAVFTAFRR